MVSENTLTQAEEWKPVVGFEGWYSVSNYGGIKREMGVAGTWSGRNLKGAMVSGGYLAHDLCKHGLITRKLKHTLVMEAFVGPRPNGLHINHKDGNKMNNFVENLEFVTPAENALHAIRTGLMVVRGERNGNSLLNETDVIAIRSMVPEHSCTNIAKMFGVDRTTVSKIVNRKNWCWLN